MNEFVTSCRTRTAAEMNRLMRQDPEAVRAVYAHEQLVYPGEPMVWQPSAAELLRRQWNGDGPVPLSG